MAVLVDAHAAHAVVVRGPHGNKLVDGVNTQKVRGNVVHFTQICGDVLFAQVADIEPQVLAVGALHAKAFAHVFCHAARNHVARGKLGLFGLIIGHKAVFVHVQQGSAVATAAFCNQNVGGHCARGVKLHGLHVAKGHNARFKGGDLAAAVADDGIGGGAVNAAITASGDQRGLGKIAHQLAGAQVTRNAAHAALAVVDEGLGLHAVVHVNAQL